MTQLMDFEESGESNDRVVQMALREIDSRLLAVAAVAMDEAEGGLYSETCRKGHTQ